MNNFSNQETTLTDLKILLLKFFKFIKNKYKIFFILIFFLFAIKIYMFIKLPNTYIARMSFIIENSTSSEQNNSNNNLSNIASQFSAGMSNYNLGSIDYISGKNFNTEYAGFSLV